jgi:hypothetical protein
MYSRTISFKFKSLSSVKLNLKEEKRLAGIWQTFSLENIRKNRHIIAQVNPKIHKNVRIKDKNVCF